MNAILSYQSALAQAVSRDPILNLARAVTCFDPLAVNGISPYEDDYGDPDQLEEVALEITRRVFPNVYVDLLIAIARDGDHADIENIAVSGIKREGIPLDDLEWLPFGVPLPAYGVEIYDPQFWEDHPNTAQVLAAFGVSNEPNPYSIEIPEVIYQAASVIEASLYEEDDPVWQEVGYMLSWLMGSSGNSSVSYTYEMMSELTPLSWDKDDVEFALEIIKEADAIMEKAWAGLAFLTATPAAMNALQANIQKLYKKGKDFERITLVWPELEGGDERRTASQSELLQLRDDAA